MTDPLPLLVILSLVILSPVLTLILVCGAVFMCALRRVSRRDVLQLVELFLRIIGKIVGMLPVMIEKIVRAVSGVSSWGTNALGVTEQTLTGVRAAQPVDPAVNPTAGGVPAAGGVPTSIGEGAGDVPVAHGQVR